MSAAATVLDFRYRRPRPCCAVNPKATSAVRRAQAVVDDGLSRAETELRAAGYPTETAQHLARMVAESFLEAFNWATDGDEVYALDALLGLRDRLEREDWRRRVGVGARP